MLAFAPLETARGADLASSVDRFLNAAERFFGNFSAISWEYVVAALALSLVFQLMRAHAWSNALRAAYPESRFKESSILAAFLVGVGMNGVLPARGGDALKIVLAKRSIPGSSYPAVISSFAVLVPFDTTIGLAVLGYAIAIGLLPAAPEVPDLPAFDIAFWAANPQALLFAVTAAAIAAIVLYAYLARHVEALWQRLKQGVVILRTPLVYLRRVAAWQAAAWLLRFATFWLFLEAFGIGGSIATVLLVMAVQSVSNALPFTPGGAGAQQALLVAALDGPPRTLVLSYSVGQQLAVAAWSILVSVVSLLLFFRVTDWRRLLREGRAARSAAERA